ncbi:MAG: DUF935 domain-containing protein [Geobacteraceae bacterium]|nr:DUF935 domain-containing protein [Geobacteraceae bacterium]
MADVTLYDQYNRPIDKTVLDQEVARPSMGGIRSIWNHGYVTGGLTPYKLATLLRQANEGDADGQLTLAEEMEEKDLHYASVLGTRKRAVARLPIVIEAYSDDPKDVKFADEIRALFNRRGIKGMIEGCLDALGKGYSVTEIMWDKSKVPWTPKRYEWRDPRFFLYDRETLRQLRLKDEADMMNGIPLPPYKFIVHEPRLKMGIPLRGGLARLAAWAYCFKNFTVKDWMAFCEVFGMPLRVGKYRPGETEDNIAILKSAVANLGSDAAAVIPEGMLIEFIESAKSSGGESLFERVADWFDKQMSKGILGQTMTADDGSSQSQATVHNEVREDIRDADAEQLAETLERDLVIPYIDLNHGPQENYPTVHLREPDQTDIPLMTEALSKLVPLGLRVEKSQVLDMLGFSDPAEGADCLGSPEPPPIPPKTSEKTALNRHLALNAETFSQYPDQEALDVALNSLDGAALQQTMADLLKPLIECLQASGDIDAALNSLAEAFPQMDTAGLQSLLARAIFVADCWGRISAGQGE